MTVRHAGDIAQTLYHVFVLPSLSASALRAAGRASNFALRPSSNTLRHARPLSSSSIRRAKPREPEIRKEKWDEEITSRLVYLVDPDTNTLLPEPRTRYDLLGSLDRSTHRLVQYGQELEGIPVCKIVSKKEEYEREKRQKLQAKERKKSEAASKSVKTLELNWAMDPNDLGHKLDRVTEFLSEGRKVEVILASKKRGRKASPEECQDVLRKIRKSVDAVDGAKEAKQMEGKVGGFATLFFQGRAVHQQTNQTPD